MYAAGEQAAVSFCNGLKGLLRIRAPALPEPATAGAPPHTPPRTSQELVDDESGGGEVQAAATEFGSVRPAALPPRGPVGP